MCDGVRHWVYGVLWILGYFGQGTDVRQDGVPVYSICLFFLAGEICIRIPRAFGAGSSGWQTKQQKKYAASIPLGV